MSDLNRDQGDQIYDGPAPGSREWRDARQKQASSTGSERDRNLAMLCHLSSLSGFLIPFGNILGPLVFWLIGKGDSDFVDAHGKASLNFQFSITLFVVAAMVLMFIAPVVLLLAPIFVIVLVYGVVMAIVNGVRAHRGDDGEYALSTRFLG